MNDEQDRYRVFVAIEPVDDDIRRNYPDPDMRTQPGPRGTDLRIIAQTDIEPVAGPNVFGRRPKPGDRGQIPENVVEVSVRRWREDNPRYQPLSAASRAALRA